MPVPAQGQLPMPSLQTYVALSFLFLAWSLLQAREGLSVLESIQTGAGTDPLPSPAPAPATLNDVDPKLGGDLGSEAEAVEETVLNAIFAGIDDPNPDSTDAVRESEDILAGETPAAPGEELPPQDAPAAGRSPDQEAILQSLSLDFGIRPEDSDMMKMTKLMLQDYLSVIILINMAFCCLILVGKAIQSVVFGDLRVIERQHLRDKLWNFSFYKVIVVFGVLNVQTLEELVLWVGWFSILAFLHGFAQLSKDRFEYLSFSPTTSNKTHGHVITLLLFILGVTGLLMAGSLSLCFQSDWNFLFFMLAECILVAVRAIYVLARYAIHLYDLHHDGVWENRGSLIYHTDLFLELVTLSLDFVHHLHMLLWVNVFLSMASLLICMQLRHLYYEIQRRVQRHRNYRRVVANMEARFPRATPEELVANNDDCAICWEEMNGARKLPCGHLFHDSCLRSWLEHETSCPTCRQSLNIHSAPTRPTPQRLPGRPNPAMMGGGQAPGNQPLNLRNHLFHFDGSRIFSWLPSFSVEVTHAQVMGPRPVVTSQLDNMARQVSQMFPNVSYQSILDDLRITRSVEDTVGNILDGRVPSVAVGVDNAAGDTNTEGPPVGSYPTMEANRGEGQDGEGLLYRQTRPAGAGERGEGSQAMEGSEDNAANWNKPNNGLPTDATLPSGGGGPSQAQPGSRPESSGGFPSYSSRFSKSSSEREAILRQRKEKLLQQARRIYQDRQRSEQAGNQTSTVVPPPPPSSSSSSPTPSSSSVLSSHHQSLFPSLAPLPHLLQRPTSQPREQWGQTPEERQRLRTATLEAALRRLQQQQRPL